MEYQNFDYQEVLKRIYTTPSVLFLGQNYLNEAISASATSNFSENEDEAQCLLHYRGMLSLRWSAIVSSSFDANIPGKCGDSFPFEARCQYDKSQKIDKTVNVGYFLFGQSCDGQAPSKPDLDLDSAPKDMFTNVLKRTIDSYGIIIIAGWDLETDWITPQILYNVLKDAPEKSVFLFGIDPEKALENKYIEGLSKKQLCKRDIIKDSFYDFLQKNECVDAQFEADEFTSDANVETLSLYSSKYKGGRIPFVLKIDKDTIYELNSKSITLLTDNIGTDTIVNNNDNLLRFSACKGDWSYYAPHNKLIINRQATDQKETGDFYELTANLIENIARKTKKKCSRFICVTGIHYSGKTTALKSFALKNKNKYPVFYIDNYVDEVTENTLKEFCSNVIDLPEAVSKVIIIICDFRANSDQAMQNICQTIRNKLTEISDIIPVVIGVTYSEYEFCKDQIKTVSLFPTLIDDELKKIKTVYNIDSGIWGGAEASSIFEMLSRYYKLQYSPDAADLRAKMKESHKKSQTIAQNDVSVAYAQIYDEEFSEFVKEGFLSSFKNELSKDGERAAKIRENLIELNNCIALSSEFGIELPVNFVFRTLDWNNYKFLNALDADCFLKRTENGYRYINAYEAGKYLLFNYADSENTTQEKEAKLKNKEVEILCTIIEICNWNDYNESSIVISLIRKFAPGSIGKERNIIGDKDMVKNPQEKKWYYYKDFYEEIGNAILKCTDNNAIAVIVAAAFLRRAYQSHSDKSSGEDVLATAYDCCKNILDNNTSYESLSTNQKVEVYIEACNVIIAEFSSKNNPNKYDFSKWNEFIELFHSLVELYNKTDKLEAAVILSIWHRAAEKKATEKDSLLFEQTMFFDSLFLPDIQSEYDFNIEIQKYEKIYTIYLNDFNADHFKTSNLKSWLLYQQRDSYKLEKGDDLTEEKTDLAKHILSVFNESRETVDAVYNQPILLKTKILCEWIEKFHSLPWAEENATNFEDKPFWDSLHEDSIAYLKLYDEKHFPSAFIKYIECIYSLVFDDGSYRFEENVRYSKKLSPWYLKRIGVANKDGQLLKFVIGTTPQRSSESFRGKISDSDSILSKLNYIHLSRDVQEYLSAGKIRLTAMNSITDRPVNIFFNAAGATAAIPSKESGDSK
ncbi:MAG: hypothetical protein RR413_09175 [Christensenellaceae bacterium]